MQNERDFSTQTHRVLDSESVIGVGGYISRLNLEIFS
jgi:hypothetical protein